MVYIDEPPHMIGKGYAHMFADSIPELHDFAKNLGIKKCWFSNKRGKNQPHYDVPLRKVTMALVNGARLVDWRETPSRLRDIYE